MTWGEFYALLEFHREQNREQYRQAAFLASVIYNVNRGKRQRAKSASQLFPALFKGDKRRASRMSDPEKPMTRERFKELKRKYSKPTKSRKLKADEILRNANDK